MEKVASEIAVSLGVEALKKVAPIIVKGFFKEIRLSVRGNIILSFNSLLPLDDAQILLEELLRPIRKKKGSLHLLKYEKHSFLYQVSIRYEPFILEEFLTYSYITASEIETSLPVSSIRIFLSPLLDDKISKDELRDLLLEMYWLYRDNIDAKVQNIRKSRKANLDSIFQIRFQFYDETDNIIEKINRNNLIKKRLVRFHLQSKEIIFRVDDTKVVEEFIKVI